MFKRFVHILVLVALLALPAAVSAQDDDDPKLTETYAFPSGVSFSYPETWAIDEDTVSDFMVMLTSQEVLAGFLQVYDLPALYGEMELSQDFLEETYVSSLADTMGFAPADAAFETVEVNERELSVLDFEGKQNNMASAGYLVTIPYTDGGYGLIVTYAVGGTPENYEAEVLAIAASLDVDPDAAAASTSGHATEEPEAEGTAEPVDIEGVELTETYAFPSGVTFSYPETWTLDEGTVSDFMVMLTSTEALAGFLQVYDLPALYGEMELGLDFIQETYAGTIADTFGFDFDAADFKTMEVAGRELSVLAFEGEQNDMATAGYLVIIPYADGGFGQIVTYVVGDVPEDYEQHVLAIAASMDVAE